MFSQASVIVAGGMHGRVGVCGRGACMVGGMHRGGRGACIAGEMATAADGTHPTGIHSYCKGCHTTGETQNLDVYFQTMT